MSSPSVAPFQVGQIGLVVRDLEGAVAFFRDKVGLTFLFQPSGDLAFLRCGSTRLMLARPEKADDPLGSSIVYFQVADIAAAHKQMVAHGVEFEGPPHLVAKLVDHDLWLAFFRDPERNLHALMCELRPPAST
jgi:methylmalonyl-CoA/ethylmalonyl-CoA epimerase